MRFSSNGYLKVLLATTILIWFQSLVAAEPLAPIPANQQIAPADRRSDARFDQQPNAETLDPQSSGMFLDGPVRRMYTGADYLFWWVKGAPLPIPLVSTGPVSTTHHGFLDRPDSTILYGASQAPAMGGHDTQDFPPFSGGRLILGYWLDDNQRLAIEGSGFMLQRRSAGYSIRADANGLPVINIPLYNTISYSPGGRPGGLPPAEDGLPASLPSDPGRFDGNAGVFTGGVKITNSLRMWGSDVAGLFNFFHDCSWTLSGVVGFKYLDLSESFNLVYDSTGVSGHYVGLSGAASDTFQTHNHFYGGTVGLRGRYSSGPLSVDLAASVALGSNHEVQNIWGSYFAFNFNGPFSTGPEAVFAQPANEGRRSANRFAVLPEARLKIGYEVTSWLRFCLGYEFLYCSSVLRPGDQINRNFPKGQTFQQGGSAVSTASPVPLFTTTDFFAHGLNIGLEFTY
jgi:hypothetical protein